MPVTVKRKNIQFSLAKVYEGEFFEAPMYAEPKLDGLRGAIVVDQNNVCGALTRTGLPIPNARLVVEEIVKSGKFAGYVLDGELMGRNWNESQSIVKTQEEHPDIANLKFHVFDIIRIAEWEAKKSSVPQHQRRRDLERMIASAKLKRTVLVEQVEVFNNSAKNFFLKQLEKGYEGIMLKDIQAPYAFKKSSAWLKYKPFFEGDFSITGAVEGRGKHAGRLGALKLAGTVQWKGRDVQVESEVGTGFDDATRDWLWQKHLDATLLGQIVEVEFQEVTEDNSLRFPSFSRMREDKAA